MSQFGYCVSNQSYNDAGQMDGCGDSYQSLSGMDSCALAGMSEYQQGLMSLTPSYCNQSSEYAPVRGMYTATQVPAIAQLQYHPPMTALYGNKYVNNMVAVDGQNIPVKQNLQVRNPMINNVINRAAGQLNNGANTALYAAKQLAGKEGFYFANSNPYASSQSQIAHNIANLQAYQQKL